jgi:hypothetical protein
VIISTILQSLFLVIVVNRSIFLAKLSGLAEFSKIFYKTNTEISNFSLFSNFHLLIRILATSPVNIEHRVDQSFGVTSFSFPP